MKSPTRRKVIFVESASAMGGVQFSTLYLAQNLNQEEWKPVVVCPEVGDLTRTCRDAGIETSIVEYPRLYSTSIRVGRGTRLPNPFAWLWNLGVVWRASRRLQSFLRESSPSVVVSKGLAAHFIAGLAARGLNLPCIWHLQDFISERSFGIYRRILGFAARRLPQQIIVDGIAIKQQLPASLKLPISVVQNGVDTSEFRPGIDGSAVRAELGITKDQIVIGHAGRITPWKGQHYFIEAFARIAADYPDACLLIVGAPVFDNDAYESRLRSMAAEFGLTDRIRFAGYRHDLSHVLAAMDIFAFTSVEKDTSPLALLSAMSSGLPTVAFDISGVCELFNDNEQLLRVSVGGTEELSVALAKLISDSSLRLRLAKAARQTVEQKFSLQQYVSRIEDILDAGARRSKILFVHNELTEFVRLDLEELRKEFEVTERFDRSRFFNPAAAWQQVSQHDLVFGWFASWHTFLPLQFAKIQRKPSVLVVGGYDVADMPQINYGHQRGGLKRWVSRRTMRSATRLVTNSNYSLQEIKRNLGFTNGAVRTVYHGVPDRFGQLPRGARQSMALTVGKVDRSNLQRKGHEPFVRAAALLPDVNFVLVGNWRDDAIDFLRSIATPNVTFTGKVNDETLVEYYRQASVYVQPSLHEGFGMSVAEAMLAGCVPVTTAAGALQEVTGDCGVQINSTEPSDLAQAIQKAMGFSDEARDAIRARVLEHFPLANRTAQLSELVRPLVNGRKKQFGVTGARFADNVPFPDYRRETLQRVG
ncbi:MAG TPA: glycosyltransferase family 4 protein, partial [Pyrinomonadaceae bacterium]|nr:glycosyltransferase family 4 protein [Pyrinomonadaceae bacterium]